MDGYKLQAYSGPSYLWLFPNNPGQPEFGPHLASNGEDYRDLISEGKLESVPFIPRFRQGSHGKKLGALVWTGNELQIVSPKFMTVLNNISATGYKVIPSELFLKNGETIPYTAIVVTGTSKDDLYAPAGNCTFTVSPRLMAALQKADVTKFRVVSKPDTARPTRRQTSERM